MIRNDWLFEPLSPSPVDVMGNIDNGDSLANFLEEDDLLDEALMILSQDDGRQQKVEHYGYGSGGQGNSGIDQEILATLTDDLDMGDDNGFQKIGTDDAFGFVGEIKRAFSPIKTIVYESYDKYGPEDSYSDFHEEKGSSELDYNPYQTSQHAYEVGTKNGQLTESIVALPAHTSKDTSEMHKKEHLSTSGGVFSSGSSSLGNRQTSRLSILPKTTSDMSTYSSSLESPKSASANINPWPSAKEYVEIFKIFLEDHSKFPNYSTAELGKCKLTGTPLQPEWLYTDPKAGIYFIECDSLRGKGSFGFPKCEGLGKKTFEWKKTSYVNNVPKAKPIISYITANGNGKSDDGSPISYRMRIVKPIGLDSPKAQVAGRWCLVDIHRSAGLARRNGPRTQKKTFADTAYLGYTFQSSSSDETLDYTSSPASATRFPSTSSSSSSSTLSAKDSISAVSHPILGVNSRFAPKPIPGAAYTGPIGDNRNRISASNSASKGTSSSAFNALECNNNSVYSHPHAAPQHPADQQSNTRRQMSLDTDLKPRPFQQLVDSSSIGPNVPLSPMKRLSLATSDAELCLPGSSNFHMTGSPKGKKMQRISSSSSGNSTPIN